MFQLRRDLPSLFLRAWTLTTARPSCSGLLLQLCETGSSNLAGPNVSVSIVLSASVVAGVPAG